MISSELQRWWWLCGTKYKLGFFGLISQQHKAHAASFSVNVKPLIALQPMSYFQASIPVVITYLHNIHVQGKQMPPAEAFICLSWCWAGCHRALSP